MSKARLTNACKRKKRLGVDGYGREFPLRDFLLSTQGLPSSNNETPSTTVRGNHSIHRRKKIHNKNNKPLKMLISIAVLTVMTGTGHAASAGVFPVNGVGGGDAGGILAAQQSACDRTINTINRAIKCEKRVQTQLRKCANRPNADGIKRCVKGVDPCPKVELGR
jgi:hypothetical protein